MRKCCKKTVNETVKKVLSRHKSMTVFCEECKRKYEIKEGRN